MMKQIYRGLNSYNTIQFSEVYTILTLTKY